MYTVNAHTHTTPHTTSEDCWGWKSRGLMGSYGRWQSVLHAQTNGVWQLPLRKTWGGFLFLPPFSFPFLLLPDWLLLPFTKHPLFTSVLFSLTSDDKPSVENHFSFFLSFLPPSHPLCVLPPFPPFLVSFSSLLFYHSDKWILNWHGVRLSPTEVHSFIIKSGKACCELAGTIMWQRKMSVYDCLASSEHVFFHQEQENKSDICEDKKH